MPNQSSGSKGQPAPTVPNIQPAHAPGTPRTPIPVSKPSPGQLPTPITR